MQSTQPHERLIHIFRSHKWHTSKAKIENKGCSVKWNGFVYFCRDITSIVGAPALLYVEENRLIVFDMSASHLCPNQLQRIELHANVS